MLAGGFRKWNIYQTGNYYVNNSGMILEFAHNGSSHDFPEIVNQISINLSPFKRLRLTISGWEDSMWSGQELYLLLLCYKTDKQTIIKNYSAIYVYKNSRTVDLDVTSVNEHTFIDIQPNAANRQIIKNAQIIISRIEFLSD